MNTIARYEFRDNFGIHKNDIRWDPVAGSFAMCEGKEAYAQTIEAVIKTVWGEIVTRRNYGIPYFTTIFSSRVLADEWAISVRNAVSNLDFIVSIDTFEYEYDASSKSMKYYLVVTTTDRESVEVSET